MNFLDHANDLRLKIKQVADHAREVQNFVRQQPPGPEANGEMHANLMLAYRHLEDASMRVGKAIQAFDGGVSVYDKKTTVGA